MKIKKISFTAICSFLFFLTAANAFAQTTAFNYQGRLTEAGASVSGTRFFRFTLFDENGAAIPGATVDQTLTVTNGIFNASLDFGAAAFPGANRSLQIAVKINAGDAYTILNPRQTINSAPYSTKSKTAETATNAAQLGGVNATRFVQSDTSGNVSLNGNLTVSGSTTFDTVNAATQFNLGGQRILASDNSGNLTLGTNSGNPVTPPNPFSGFGKSTLAPQVSVLNTFLGNFAGANNTTGTQNTFTGYGAGYTGTTANSNAFFGSYSGFYNTNGTNNSFFGDLSGTFNTTGSVNVFIGAKSGWRNTTGAGNVFIGAQSGNNNTSGMLNTFTGFNSGGGCVVLVCGYDTTGDNNAFYGYQSGLNISSGSRNSFFGNNSGKQIFAGNDNAFFGDTTGINTNSANNTFIGANSGNANITGSNNTLLGFQANFGAGNLTNATAIGANALVAQSNSLVLGNNLVNVGIGTSTPNSKLTVAGLIETTTGGVKFPDGTIQISAATGGGNGILNQTTLQAGANFNIGGNGTIVGTLTAGSLFGNGAGLTNLNASNITTGTLSNARLGLIPTANIADGSVTANKIASGQVVKNLNGLTDNVTLAAGANITITPVGNTLTIASTGGGSGGILNQTALQTGANFNIAGAGRASFFDANDYRSNDTSILNSIGGVLRVGLGAGIGAGGNQNTFLGNNSGDNAGTSDNNTFVGYQSGRLANGTTGGNSFFGAFTGNSTTGGSNSFFGARSGELATTGSNNSFFGYSAGRSNGGGNNNSFFGVNSGAANAFGGGNSFFGFNAGTSNTNGGNNTFIGIGSGIGNTNGGSNTFVGGGTGQQNITGSDNSFFGFGAGLRNDTGGNSFFGKSAGAQTTSGSLNMFAGFEAGISNTTGGNNVFVGTRTGELDTTGGNNTFVGGDAGRANSNGSRNTYLGYGAQGFVGGNTLINATAIGAFANVMQSNSLILGSINGVNSATADTRVGIGTNAPKAKLDVTGGNVLIGSPGQGMILKSPNGATCKLLSIDNAGAMVLASIACP